MKNRLLFDLWASLDSITPSSAQTVAVENFLNYYTDFYTRSPPNSDSGTVSRINWTFSRIRKVYFVKDIYLVKLYIFTFVVVFWITYCCLFLNRLCFWNQRLAWVWHLFVKSERSCNSRFCISSFLNRILFIILANLY